MKQTKKRGGRPPLDPSGTQQQLTIRLSPAEIEGLRRAGAGKPSRAARQAIRDWLADREKTS